VPRGCAPVVLPIRVHLITAAGSFGCPACADRPTRKSSSKMDKQVDQKRPHLRENGVLHDPDLVGARVVVAVSHQRTEAGDLPWARLSFGQCKADVSRNFTTARAGALQRDPIRCSVRFPVRSLIGHASRARRWVGSEPARS
jgi:hypothetical protein